MSSSQLLGLGTWVCAVVALHGKAQIPGVKDLLSSRSLGSKKGDWANGRGEAFQSIISCSSANRPVRNKK